MIKLKTNFLTFLFFFNLFLITGELYSQEVDIIPYLKAIENGNIGFAKEALYDLKEKNPDDPSVMFLDGVLKENGQEAIVIYQNIVDNFPKSKYADAALYRIFSYYYALGLYDTAREKLNQLDKAYPDSPYLSIANQNISALDNPQEEKKEVAEEEKQETSEDEYKFTIQAGAFTNLDNAKKLIGEFENAGIFCKLGEKTVAGATFNVVYAGKFIKYEDAENFLQVLNSRFNLNGSIVPFPAK
jgi:tetratricopeptide (TPR) repeat protein